MKLRIFALAFSIGFVFCLSSALFFIFAFPEKSKENLLKCYKYLLSKGFDYDVAKSAVEKVGNLEDDIL
jgi:hypothetical protein